MKCALSAAYSVHYVQRAVLQSISMQWWLAFWVSARGRRDHCLGRFVLPPNNFKPGQLASSTNAKVAFLYLCISYFSFLSTKFSWPPPTAPNKRIKLCVFRFQFKRHMYFALSKALVSLKTLFILTIHRYKCTLTKT